MKNLNELCLLLVEDIYGDLCAHVYKTLSDFGRIPLRTLVHEADIPAKHVYHGLTVLIQQHLILHHTPPGSPTFYEVDWDGAYNLLRSGKIVSHVEARLGPKPAQALSSLLQLGHARVSDMEEAFKYEKVNAVPRPATNGVHAATVAPTDIAADKAADAWTSTEDQITGRQELHLALWDLLEAGYVSKVHPKTYLPPADRQNELEEDVRTNQFAGSKTTGPKARIKFQNALTMRKRQLQDEEFNFQDSIDRGAKRIKVGTDISSYEEVKRQYGRDTITLHGSLVLKVNFEKCKIAMRSERLVEHSRRFLGDTTSRIYEALLHVIEKQILECKPREEMLQEEQDGDTTEEHQIFSGTTRLVLDELEKSSDGFDNLDLDLGGPKINGAHNHKPGSKNKHGDCRDNSIKARNDLLILVEMHLRLLAEHPNNYVVKIGDRGHGEYEVPFHELRHTLKHSEIESIITFRFGTVASRIVRILKSRGKLDEKQICSFALLKLKDIRSVLDEMHSSGYVETQEVPKDNTRQPGRSLYLWYFDQSRVEQVVLQRSYKAMSRCLQRARVQRGAVSATIEKAERTDVIGNEDKYLTELDRMNLRRWREQEEKLLCQVARMDEGVAVIRDY
ncbi:RNA polymerase III subunit RPC82-domain-containing protein [Elsinoe ampelina]|uniref:DNA-directed RNA polymerase III subunit RPC3 n=1 Tax=Elsinoe ampelina TaxID=302913 RepID=A0A6A6G1L1_9PEZI|nr:RNA polymerase III subunit RPC82-domain-containing protein [Elsinoe ampelina]